MYSRLPIYKTCILRLWNPFLIATAMRLAAPSCWNIQSSLLVLYHKNEVQISTVACACFSKRSDFNHIRLLAWPSKFLLPYVEWNKFFIFCIECQQNTFSFRTLKIFSSESWQKSIFLPKTFQNIWSFAQGKRLATCNFDHFGESLYLKMKL